MHVKLHFNQICTLKRGGGEDLKCPKKEVIAVASYFHVYENEDAVSHCHRHNPPFDHIESKNVPASDKFYSNKTDHLPVLAA
jgi:hypothetical protein